MPNWCTNFCSVDGTDKNISAFFDALENLESKAAHTGVGQIFNGITYPKNTHIWMFDIASDRDTNHFSYTSKWAPIVEAMRLTSEYFNIEITVDYEEMGCLLYGQYSYKNGKEVHDVFLEPDEFDLEWDEDKCKTPDGETLESEYEYYEEKLQEKLNLKSL